MKTVPCFIIFAAIVLSGCAKKSAPEFFTLLSLQAQLKSFTEEKKSQARSLALAEGKQLPPEAKDLFSAIKSGNWEQTTNDFAELKRRVDANKTLYGSWWQPVLEVYGTAEQFALGDQNYVTAYGYDITQSIPPGGIYFGATEPGRFIVTAMEGSQIEGEPFLVLSQNLLSDSSYLDYLRSMYGNKIHIPTAADLQMCFDDYYRDFQERQANHLLQTGEEVTNGPDGKMHIMSHMSDIQVYGAVARLIFEQNSNREFYVEESYPLEWMNPHLEPYGLIFRLNRKPLMDLPDGTVEQDHDYWTKAIAPMIGNWLKDTTSVQDVAAFADRVYLHQDFSNFTGDRTFVENAFSQRMFSKERGSIAGLYAWRAQHDTDPADKRSMATAADFAFRQSWALSPDSPETVYGYVTLLIAEKRSADALVVAETAAKFRSGPAVESLDQLVFNLKHQ
jgi:hypothetical protein